MSRELMYILIAKMHIKLNKLIEASNYNLQDEEVQRYSRRLDKVLIRYNRIMEDTKNYMNKQCTYGIGNEYIRI